MGLLYLEGWASRAGTTQEAVFAPGGMVYKTWDCSLERAVLESERMNRLFCIPQVKPLGLLKPSSLMKVSGRFKAHQDALPRLPVPPLQQSLDHYLKALQPIVSEEEWAHTKQLVDEFQTSGGVGERLQKGLERRAKKMENWVSEVAASCQSPRGHRSSRAPLELTLRGMGEKADNQDCTSAGEVMFSRGITWRLSRRSYWLGLWLCGRTFP